MRRPLVAGNWKMHGSRANTKILVEGIKQRAKVCEGIEVLVLPSFVHLQQVENLLLGTEIRLGAQNLYLGSAGAFTGEVSGPMLVEYGCSYVLVGHSERRIIFQENLELIAAKFKAAIQANLRPILCIGETKEQYEQGVTETILREQLESVMQTVGIDAFSDAVIAYEPVWAIGTGLTATPEQAQSVHVFIRKLLAKESVELAEAMRIVYGGSVKPDNAAKLFSMPDIDGGLVGGASLNADDFLAICQAAN